jgi:transposase
VVGKKAAVILRPRRTIYRKSKDGKINDARLYRRLDRILPHKTKLERHLKEPYGELFGADFDVLLYYLTSTYVEGAAEKNPMVRRGYSRDHRPDCEQMVIALIVNNKGFPFSYETFDDNRADVSTRETILRMVERTYGKARRIWVFDRGIASEKNLAATRKRGGQYLAGMLRSQMKRVQRLPVVGGARCSLRSGGLSEDGTAASVGNSRQLPSCTHVYPLSPTNIS